MTLIQLRARLCAALAAGLLTVATQAFGDARTIDIRDCPLNTVTFIDPWSGGEFKVDEVGTSYVYLCADEVRKNRPGQTSARDPMAIWS